MADMQAPEGARTSAQKPVTYRHIADELDKVYDLVKLGMKQNEDESASVQNSIFQQLDRLVWSALTVARHHAETASQKEAE